MSDAGFCYDCQRVTNGDCGRHGATEIYPILVATPERPESPSEEAMDKAAQLQVTLDDFTSPEDAHKNQRDIAVALAAARDQARRDRDMEWWEAIVQVDGVAPTPEAAKKFLLDLATHEQEGAREQGRREGLEQAASLVLRLTPYASLADAIRAFAEVPKG